MRPDEPLPTTSVVYFVDQVARAVERAARWPGTVVLVGGGTWLHRTQVLREFAAAHRFHYVPLGLELSAALKDVAPDQRPHHVADMTRALAHPPAGSDYRGCTLDHIEILFHPDLRVRVASLLAQLARERPLVASWPGEYVNGRLKYAVPGHPEYQHEPARDIIYIDLEA